MSFPEDRTLVLDMLQPFRRVLSGPTSKGISTSTSSTANSNSNATSSAAPASSAHTPLGHRLNFDDTISDILGKRKASSPLKRSRTESDTSMSPVVASPWQINRYKAEAIESKVQIEKLEKQIAHQHLIRNEMGELFENERRIASSERKSKDNTIADFEQRLQTMKSKETDLKEQLSKSIREFNEYKLTVDKEKQHFQKEIYDLKTDLTNSRITNNEQISLLKQEVMKLSQSLDIYQKEASEYKSAYEEAAIENRQIESLQEKCDQQSLALHQAESKLRDLESSKKDLEEMKVLQKRLVSMPSLEKEVQRLREEATELRVASHQNLLLEEQVHHYKTRLESLEPLYQKFGDLQKQHLELERTLDEWKRIGSAYEAPEPQMLIKRLENLQQRELTFLTEKKDTDVTLSAAKSELADAKLENKKILSKLSDAQNMQKTQESFIHRLQKKLLLVSRERDSYRQQLDCYEKELTVMGNIGTTDNQHSAALMNSRVDILEKSLQGYRELVAKLEEDIANMRGMPILQEQLSRLKEDVMNLTRDNEVLRSHNDKLEMQVERSFSKGDQTNIPTTKILHLTQNPLTKAEEIVKNELEKAHLEIQQLKYKIKKLEANELEMTQKLSETLQSHGPSSEDVEQLKSQLESGKIKLQRMKEVYTTSFQEYRDVCYMLFGYKMDRTSVNNYRLSSIFADSPNQYLNFILSGGGIEMVQTDYAGTISDLVDEHLRHHKSFPVFLSELTLDLFKRTTMLSDSTIQ
ncbi:mitotic spindle assembly checkpoint protein MAD1-like [Arctopsyche grandis]|uniref:mitotic spindle assembly checkpoint protein MAD1-like n=1 Tax=Arctopsyche grandis TaxID=121162 RepID=UPI00406D6A13